MKWGENPEPTDVPASSFRGIKTNFPNHVKNYPHNGEKIISAKEEGHDGVIAKNIVDVGAIDTNDVPASTDYVEFKSEQEKSVDNRGTFDAGSPDITFSVMERAEKSRYIRVDNPVHTEKEARAILTRKKNPRKQVRKPREIPVNPRQSRIEKW